MGDKQADELRAQVEYIAAAWDVWGEAQHAIRQLARRNEWQGDLPDGAQRQQLKEQFNAQIFEAYSRSRVQCAIVLAVDGVDMIADFDRHWEETWGAPTITKAAAVYAGQIFEARARQRQSRAAAAAQSEAFDAAGVLPNVAPRCELAPPGWWCTRNRGHEGPCAAQQLEATEAAPTVPPPPRRWWWPLKTGH